MSEVEYRNLGELVQEARKKYGFNKVGRSRRYPIDHKNGRSFSTGFSRVLKVKSPNYHQGFNYQYKCYDNKEGPKVISSVDIKKLHDRVKNEGMEWEIVDMDKAQKIADFHNIDIKDLE